MPRVLLYVHPAQREEIYLRAIAETAVECDVVHSFADYFAAGRGGSYNGLLLDIVSSIRATGADREVIKNLLEVYPSLRLRYDPASEEIRTLMTGAGSGQKITIEQFIDTYCRSFPARGLRLYKRKPIHCNVLYSLYGDMPDEESTRSVTIDLSEGGCFIYTIERLAVGTCLWLSFVELMDNSPIYVRVCWSREWGHSMNIPGIGLQFLEIDSGQRDEIAAILAGSSAGELPG
ncbi:MAG: hypothetical protein B6I36_08470 [Desulfobacteraceae bacterium 4572_35.1]|nr:MAG: hypothetical protein B6I36_08470 [Desulfobacteraceae bacterium 4572_35.1]